MDIVRQRSVQWKHFTGTAFEILGGLVSCNIFLSWNRRWGLWDPKLQIFIQCLPNVGQPIGPQSIEEPENNEAHSPFGTKGMHIVMAIL